ncbi:NAD(P)H-dependent oxidoreductase [Paenibacillus validus]|uniref:NAD(P)H-dependent oxidoreductase n=1 Tax=Paenibacillus validus TaxID=44253 RepID=UPI003D2A67B4
MSRERIIEAYRFRHACKEFDASRQIREEDFHFILETGRLSPSSFGFEPWSLVVLQNPQIRAKLLPVTWGGQKQIPTASHLVLLLARNASSLRPDAPYITSMLEDVRKIPPELVTGARDRYRKFLDSDFKLSGNDRAMFEWACRQSYIALGNMMTAAAQIGIDSCPIEGFDKEAVETLLRAEGVVTGDDFGLACMAAFGYRIREPRDKTRRPLDQVVRWVL